MLIPTGVMMEVVLLVMAEASVRQIQLTNWLPKPK